MANAIVGQSGGPTSVINASLTGVFQACQHRGAEHVYGMLHGIQGLLSELGSGAESLLSGTMNSIIDTSDEAFSSLCSSDFASAIGSQLTSVYDINAALSELLGSFSTAGIGDALSAFSPVI